ncbi:Fc receptor-like protein 1 [Morone saxatilis]|uniref:Fc receptor-like protein 1 n=1 Tax=Morone saxatilis TaxID=34816 RepID=UPI0015E22280|nr:Fc receptor-like protein 1 [Morone saxatilis]
MHATPFCLMLSCLQVSPDRSQFFRYDSISLRCEDQLNSTGLKVKRNTSEGWTTTCGFGWGSSSSDSTCIIGNTYPSDSGVYWCESGDRKRSNNVNITITDRAVLLDSPALPVLEGATVILRCKAEMDSSDHRFNFYKDGCPISNNSTGEITIHSASKSDEGLYKCSISGGGESLGSWLTVEASLPPSPAAPSAASSSVSVPRLMCHLLVGTPYLLSTILLGLIYRDRNRAAQMVAERRGSNDVIMEIIV